MFLLKDEINLALAIEDILPVAFFAVGLFFVAKMIANKTAAAGKLAFAGGVLVTLGGLLKVCWKLIQSLGGADIPFLNYSLFVLMSAGFICLAWALWKSRTAETKAAKIWLIPIFLTAALWLVAAYIGFFTASRAWFFILLGATTLANLALLFQLIFRAVQNKLWLCAAFYLLNLVIVFTLARTSDQTVTLQWIKQIINTFSQAAFAAGSWLLLKNNNK